MSFLTASILSSLVISMFVFAILLANALRVNYQTGKNHHIRYTEENDAGACRADA